MSPADCPAPEELERYSTGELDDDASARIERHVESCAVCEARVADASGDLGDLHVVRAVLREEAGAAPERIGPFRILREIGRGGMGVVYLAEQERPRREVALKVLRPGTASPIALRRFELEAEALGRLRHPGIAAVYEAGVAEIAQGGATERVPYFAMEHVRGERIDRYAEARGLNARTRMDLLARVADAVHHAHVNGVVHRDLKPGNVLVEPGPEGDVSTGSGAGHPRVLDFGVARTADRGGATLRTTTGEVLGTVPYMSPEQLAGAGDVDARSDVYALGVMAYELLAGRPPLDLRGKPLPEAARIVREVEPEPLGRVAPACRGDLETIVAKAMEKDSARRYQSASELAADLRRFLAGQAILARPASAMYQLGRIARRNRAAVALAALLLVALVAFAAAMGTLGARAVRAERVAVAEAQSSEQVLGFVLNMFAGAAPDDRNPAEVPARALVDRAAAGLGELDDQPEVQARLMYTLGGIYHRLGLYREGLALMMPSLEARRRLLPPEHVDIARSLNGAGRLYLALGILDSAETHLRGAAEMVERTLGGHSREYALCIGGVGQLLHAQGRHDEAIEAHRAALEANRAALGADHREVVTAAANVGVAMVQRGRFEEAVPMLREALAGMKRARSPKSLEVAQITYNLGAAIMKSGDVAGAEPLFRESLEIRRELLGDEHPAVATQLHNLAVNLAEQGRHAEAEPLLREALRIRERATPDHWMTAETRSVLGEALAKLGRAAEAEPLLVAGAAGVAAVRGADDTYAERARGRLEAFRGGWR